MEKADVLDLERPIEWLNTVESRICHIFCRFHQNSTESQSSLFSHFEQFPGQKTRGHCQSLPFCQRIQGWGRYGKREGYDDDGVEIVDDDADDDIVCLAIPCRQEELSE